MQLERNGHDISLQEPEWRLKAQALAHEVGEKLGGKFGYKANGRVLKAITQVSRHEFCRLASGMQDLDIGYSYRDFPSSVRSAEVDGYVGQRSTVSAPSMVAVLLSEVLGGLDQDWDALRLAEVGSGSGYLLALARETGVFGEITGFEINKELVERTRKLVETDGVVTVEVGDWEEQMAGREFDGVVVSASVRNQRQMDKLLGHVKFGGVLVAPVSWKLIESEGLIGKLKANMFLSRFGLMRKSKADLSVVMRVEKNKSHGIRRRLVMPCEFVDLVERSKS